MQKVQKGWLMSVVVRCDCGNPKFLQQMGRNQKKPLKAQG